MQNNAATSLYDLLVTRDLEPETLDSAGKPVSDPSEAELFNFDWKVDGKNYGTVVALLGRDNELEIYYGDNLGRAMDSEHKGAWYDFLAQMKNFATRNLLTFELNNINRLKYTMQGMAAIKEGLFEGYYGRKNISYSDQPQKTRLMIRHSRDLAEGEPRYRAIESIYVENAAGERFRVPTRSLTHGRMLARHVTEGGTPYDTFGEHINSMVAEMATLAKFVRAARGNASESTAGMIESAVRHYQDLKAKAKRMIGRRGYIEARDSFDPAETTASESVVADIREMFVQQQIDPRIESALPILARIRENTMPELQEFADWARMTEATWARPDTPAEIDRLRQLMAEPLPVGPDATNATEQLHDIFGDDQLFDSLADLAATDADADARPMILARLDQLGLDLGITLDADDQAVGEDLDTDGVMMNKPSNMSSESLNPDLQALRRLALV